MKYGFQELEPFDPADLAALNGVWEIGDGAVGSSVPAYLYVVLEMIYAQLGGRYELSCAKSIMEVTDEMSKVWHTDGDNPDDPDTKYTVLIYRCHSAPLQIDAGDVRIEIDPYPGRVIVIDNTQRNIVHRCRPGNEPRSYVKVTLK